MGKINKDLDLKIEDVFNSLDKINEVKISSSFKQNVLRQIIEVEEVESVAFNWFTPKLQLAAMAIIIFINFSAVMYTFSSSSNETDIDCFAKQYNLVSETTSIIN